MLNHISIVKLPLPNSKAALSATLKLSPVPSKYPDHAVIPKGLFGAGWELPAEVIANAFVELSMNWLLWQVSRDVFVILVSGVVGTVKFAV